MCAVPAPESRTILQSAVHDLSTHRREYSGEGLWEDSAPADPFDQFGRWMTEALESGAIYEPTAMTLATASPHGRPSLRVVLLKGVDHGGFVFFTNYESDKARDLEANPGAALLFYWDRLHRQVRVRGTVSRVSVEESRAYFESRPRESRIAAWASKQSAPLESRAQLEEAFARYEREFEGREQIELPPFWGGYRLAPEAFEFWQGRESRLHDRLQYTRAGDSWKIERLAP